MDNPIVSQQEAPSSAMSFARLDVVILALTAPLLLVPTRFHPALSGIALSILLLPYIARLVFGKPLSLPTAANLPVALLALVFLPLAFLMSPAPWTITWARLTTLAWSIALFFAIVNWPVMERRNNLRTRLGGPTTLFLALGLFVSLAGLLGMRSVEKLFSVPAVGFLADYLGWGSGLPTNEIAGVLTLFVPFVAALTWGCLITGRRRNFFLLLPLTALLTVTLVLTQSRTGLTATALGAALAIVLTGSINRKWLAVALVAIGMGLIVIRLSPIMDWFVFAGANSWNSVIGPRWGIWEQAVDAIGDHPLWGMGLGLFGSLVRFVYPLVDPAAGPVLEDAHNLYLQTALDFGLAGTLVFLVAAAIVIVSAVRLARVRPPQSLSRLWAVGLLGGLLAHALYSLTDAVALGTLAGVPLWYAFGLVMGASRGRLVISWTDRTRLLFGGAVALVALGSALMLPVNRAGQLAAIVLVEPTTDAGAVAAEIDGLAAKNCRARWFEGLVYHAAGDAAGRSRAWDGLLDCSDRYTAYMASLAPGDVDLARRAIAAQPQSAAGYFWLAPAVAAGDPEAAIGYYHRGLEIAPHDGRHWLALADLLAQRDEAAALDAYLQACLNGDPGANGCLRAGSLAEARGDLTAAVEYYRLSNWEGALARARELELQLVTVKP